MFIKSFIISFLFIFPAFAVDVSGEVKSGSYRTVDEIMAEYQNIHPTECSSKIFAQALKDGASVLETDEEDDDYIDEDLLQMWARNTILDAEVLRQIQKCPEIANAEETETIIFSPVKYTFPWGQSVTVNYTTQPKVIDQKIKLSEKPSLPTDEASPRLMDPNDPAKYVNTDPAWYAVMIVQHDSLRDFVGEDKNNLISMKWINDNIDKIYPNGNGGYCTDKTAISRNGTTINKVVHEVVDLKDDSNDYYIAGDKNLEWVMWAEVTLDVVLTAATLGGSQALMANIRSIRTVKTMKQLIKNMKRLDKFPYVKKYAKLANKMEKDIAKVERLEKNVANAEKYGPIHQKWIHTKKNDPMKQVYKQQMDEILKEARKLDSGISKHYLSDPDHMKKIMGNLRNERAALEKEIEEVVKQAAKDLEIAEKGLIGSEKAYEAGEITAEELAKQRKKVEELKNFEKYTENANELKSMLKYLDDLKAVRRPQTGNIITRPFKKMSTAYKTYRAINSAKNAEKIAKASKVARAGMGTFSAKAKDWLFHTSLKFGEKLVRFEQNIGVLTGALYILGDFYDRTSETSQQYTNGIEFKPYCLLSADDLNGQENEVNYGMWLMWTGNSTMPEDDDAAYLQVMDFAAKLSDELNRYQSENSANCDVDIYIVRPIIRLDESDPKKTKGELYYLFMNDEPWTTDVHFGYSSQNNSGSGSFDDGMFIANPNQASEFAGTKKVGYNTQYIKKDGTIIERSGGTVAWRNNNPGNIIKSKFAMQHGAIGSSGRWAVFPNEQAGINAIISLLKTKSYRNLNISQAIHKWCPWGQGDNPDAYTSHVSKMTGLNAGLVINNLSDQQLMSIARAIQKVEGWKVGKEQNVSGT